MITIAASWLLEAGIFFGLLVLFLLFLNGIRATGRWLKRKIDGPYHVSEKHAAEHRADWHWTDHYLDVPATTVERCDLHGPSCPLL